ncbi:MAG: TIGR02646 family protein [Gallionella sp.]|nr:TIGR02646 family protein [Gallionella sp.]
MRSIAKSAEPVELASWKQAMQTSLQNLNYDNLPSNVKDLVKAHLLKEQGYLCAYTMLRLHDVADCHIEHIRPQNDAPELDLDYSNMAACFPKNGGDVSHGYGAPVKAGIPITPNNNFVSPHSPNSELRFLYDTKGCVCAAAGDAAANQTIQTLRLNHDTLVDLRSRAIEAHGLTLRRSSARSSRALKSAAEARRFAIEVMQFGTDGYLESFCVALSQAALDYANKEEARAQRMRAQH